MSQNPDQGIFSAPDQGQPPASQTPANQPTAGELAVLVGEGRKYKTVDELAKAYLNADGFIEQLKTENQKLREEVAKGKTVDDLMERIKAQPAAQAPATQQTPAQSAGAITAEQVAKIVSDTVTGLETKRTKDANLAKADAEMRRLFGDKAGEVFAKEADTPEKRRVLQELASVDPAKFVALFQRPTQAAGARPDSGTSFNTGALDPTAIAGRAADPSTKEYYDNLRRTKPNEYYSAAVQLQMQRAAVANPNRFFGRS